MVGLGGLEPPTSSLSEMDGRALCYPAFPLVVRLRYSYRDGVNSLPAAGCQAVPGRVSPRSPGPAIDDDRSAMDRWHGTPSGNASLLLAPTTSLPLAHGPAAAGPPTGSPRTFANEAWRTPDVGSSRASTIRWMPHWVTASATLTLLVLRGPRISLVFS